MFVKHYVQTDFFNVWDNQGVGCLNAFIREFRQRLIDMRWQAWDHHVNTSDRFSLYNLKH